MPEPNTHYSDEVFLGTTSFGGAVNLPDACVRADNVEPGADIPASMLRHRHAVSYRQKNGADVATETMLVHVARADGDIVDCRLRPTTAPTGGDKQYTVDVQKADDASGTWVTILTAAIVVDSSSVDDTLQSGVLATLSYDADDAFRVVVTASGSTGSQGQGFDLVFTLDEQAN